MVKLSCITIFVVCLQLSSILALGGNRPLVSFVLKKVATGVEKGVERIKSLNLPIPTCTMFDTKCLRDEAQTVLKNFTNGIPELGIESFEVLKIDKIDTVSDNITQELTNIKITGMNNAKVNDMSFNEFFKVMRLSFDTTFIVDSDYTVNGTLFLRPIYGSGTATYKLKNIQSDMLFLYDIIEKADGKHRLKLNSFRYGFTIKDGAEYHYRNLFGGDKEKNDAVCDLITKNWTIVTHVFGEQFYNKIYERIFEAIKKYSESIDLEDLIVMHGGQQ